MFKFVLGLCLGAGLTYFTMSNPTVASHYADVAKEQGKTALHQGLQAADKALTTTATSK